MNEFPPVLLEVKLGRGRASKLSLFSPRQRGKSFLFFVLMYRS